MYVTLQPTGGPDGVLPYPFHVNEDGTVGRQDFWRGRVAHVIGFVDNPDSYDITLTWSAATSAPQAAVGKYAVTADNDGGFSTHVFTIQSVKVQEGRCD